MSILIKVVSKNEQPMGSYTQITVRELAARFHRGEHKAEGGCGGAAAGPTEQVTSELPLER